MKKILLSVFLVVLALTALVGCGGKKDDTPTPTPTQEELPTGLKDAKSFLKNMYRSVAEVTTSSYSRVAKVVIGEDTYPVVWSVSFAEDNETVRTAVSVALNESGNTYDVTIKQISVEVSYTLTATISDSEGNQTTLEYNHKVPMFKVSTWADYVAAAKNDPLIVEGVVTAIVSKTNGASNNCVFLEDNDGAYYVYKLDNDPVTDGIKIGMTVRATGVKDLYSGTYELVSATLEVIDETVKTVTPKDYTEIASNAETLTDNALVEHQSSYVTIKNVTLDTRTADDISGGYYPFTFTGKDGKVLRSYIRISSSTCALSKADQTKFIANHKAGYTADVTGIISLFNGSFYLVPATADAISNLQLPALNDADAVAYEKAHLTVADVEKSGDVILPVAGAAYTKVAITWELSDNAVAVLGADGKTLTVTCADEATEITLTATLTAGDATDTLEIKVKVASKVINWITPEEALEICGKLETGKTSEEKYYIYGTIIDDPTAEYCNFNLGTTANPLLVYGLANSEGKKYGSKKDITELPVAKGDLVYISGYLTNYNGTLEVKNAVLETAPEAGKSNATAYDAAKAIELCSALNGDNKEKSTERFYFVGTIIDDPTAEYCNFHFKAGDTEIVAYGLWTADGSKRYGSKRDIAELPVAKGDTVVLYSLLQNYSGTLQFAEARLFSVKKASSPVDPTPTPDVLKQTLTFDFTTVSSAKGTELTDAKTVLAKYADVANVIASATATKVYEGNGNGGAKANAAGLIKFGTKSEKGVLTINFAEGTKINKVVVNCHDFYATSDSYPTTENTLDINDVALANPYNADATPADLTFELTTPTNSLTITANGRIVVYSIVIYVAAE